jgi:hypothetical protein
VVCSQDVWQEAAASVSVSVPLLTGASPVGPAYDVVTVVAGLCGRSLGEHRLKGVVSKLTLIKVQHLVHVCLLSHRCVLATYNPFWLNSTCATGLPEAQSF